ncbi:MAG TPA: hypothetical protein VGL53_29155 [Bryobacteraceae bacterium]|jgi:hypothetical protein
MNLRCAAVFACCLSAAIGLPGQTGSAPQPQAEQVETGTVSVPIADSDTAPFDRIEAAGPHTFLRHYKIRLLPVSSFPQLPKPVAQELTDRGCMIPQTYEAREPENVIHGSFEKKGSDDWATLCSIRGVTTLYVFFQSNLTVPIPLRHQPDSQWLGVEWSLDYGSAWGIAARAARLLPASTHADHDGIEDAFIEKSSTIYYFQEGRWTTLDGSQ